MAGHEETRRGRALDAGSDALGVPDIQVGRKALAALVVGLIACAFGAGYALARRDVRTTEVPSTARPVEIRIDPTSVKLADTALELKSLPPLPEQLLGSGGEKP